MASESYRLMGGKRGTKINVDNFAHRFNEILNPELVWYSQSPGTWQNNYIIVAFTFFS